MLLYYLVQEGSIVERLQYTITFFLFDIPYLYSGSGHTLADAVAKEQILDPVTAVKEEIYRYLRIYFLYHVQK